MINVIIADDHPLIVNGTSVALQRDSRIRVVGTAASTEEVFALLATRECDVLLTDFHFEGSHEPDGLTFLGKLHRQFPQLRIVVLSMFGTPSVLRATQLPGVYGAVSKATDPAELVPTVVAAYERRRRIDEQAVPLRSQAVQQTGESDLRLSPREEEVVRLLLSGMSVSQIAARLHRSMKTISAQKSSAMSKLGAESNADLFRLGFSLLSFSSSDASELASPPPPAV